MLEVNNSDYTERKYKLTCVYVSKPNDAAGRYCTLPDTTRIFRHPSNVQWMCIRPGVDDTSRKISEVIMLDNKLGVAGDILTLSTC